jgi:response regulator NasT
MRVLLIESQPERALALKASLVAVGHEVSVMSRAGLNLMSKLQADRSEMILIDQDSPDRDTLECVCVATRDRSCPVVMFSPTHDPVFMRTAMDAGICAYVAGDVSELRVRSVMEVAMVRHGQMYALRNELEETKRRLADRKQIERAKGIVMKHRRISENEAFALMRKQAMDRNLGLREIAEQICAAASLLG